MQTEWGDIHTVGIKALVELKKTQRLEDYPIISKLALAWFDPKVAEFGRQLLANADVPESSEQPVREFFQKRIAELQMVDRYYWRDIIGELKALRATGGLMPEGGLV